MLMGIADGHQATLGRDAQDHSAPLCSQTDQEAYRGRATEQTRSYRLLSIGKPADPSVPGIHTI